MNDYEIQSFLEARDDDDDGLLNHGNVRKHGFFKKKENPYYTDYKNQQIMKGKAIKTEKGWKKDERRKKWLKRLALIGATAAAGTYIYNKKHPYHKNRKRIERRGEAAAGRITGRYNAKVERKIAKANTGSKRAAEWLKKRNISFEESFNYLLENYDFSTLQKYTAFNEGYSKEEWKYYRDQRKAKGLDYEPYKVWKAKKKRLKRGLILGTLGTAVILANTKKGKEIRQGIKTNYRNFKDNHLENKLDNKRYKATYKSNKKQGKFKNKVYASTFHEELSNFDLNDLQHYYNEILTNEDFMKESYERYKVMCESQGVIPVSEGVFETAKEKLTSYSDAAIEAIKKKKKEKEKKIEELKKEKEEKRKKEAKEEAEVLKKMSPAERRAYLQKKKKAELEEEEKEQDKRDLKQAAKTSFVRGGAEEAGHMAVKLASKMFMR